MSDVLGSGGVTPVAVYSTQTFDASTIIASTVKFGPAGIGTSAQHAHLMMKTVMALLTTSASSIPPRSP